MDTGFFLSPFVSDTRSLRLWRPEVSVHRMRAKLRASPSRHRMAIRLLVRHICTNLEKVSRFSGTLMDNSTRNSLLDTFQRSINGSYGDWLWKPGGCDSNVPSLSASVNIRAEMEDSSR